MTRTVAPLWLAARSRFADATRVQARSALALIAVLLLALAAVGVSSARPQLSRSSTDGGDVALYDGVIDSVRHGGSYYTVTADALRHGDYPLRPFVAFRLPTLAVALSLLSDAWRPVPLYLLSLAVLLLWAHRLRIAFAGRVPMVLALVMLLAGCITGTQAALVSFHDVWAGLFIALALGLRRPGRWVEAVAFGFCAMLVRELAAPFAVVMAAAAWFEGERREAAGWLASLGLFALVLATHAHAVAAVLRPSDPASPGWSGLLGPAFVAKALVLSTGLQIAPLALAAPLVGLSLVGWAAWRDPLAIRVLAMLAVYAMLIGVAARPDNFYWTLLVAPASLVGLAFAPDALRDLIRAARDRRRITVTRVVR